MGSEKFVDVECTIKHRTAKAILVDVGGEEPVWIPLSMVEDESEDSILVKEWVAVEKGLV